MGQGNTSIRQTQGTILDQRTKAKMQTMTAELVQMNHEELLNRIEQELDGNAALEVSNDTKYDIKGEEVATNDSNDTDVSNDNNDTNVNNENNDSNDNDDNDELPSTPSSSGYQIGSNNGEQETLNEHLLSQLQTFRLTTKQENVAKYIIGNIGDKGLITDRDNNEYTNADDATYDLCEDLMYYQDIPEAEELVPWVLNNVIHKMEPVGVGARTRQECILLQLADMNASAIRDLAIRIMAKNYDEVLHNHTDRIFSEYDIDSEKWQEVKDFIHNNVTYNPGAKFASSGIGNPDGVINPEYIVSSTESGDFRLTINDRLPDLVLDASFLDVAQKLDKKKEMNKREREAFVFLRDTYSNGKLFIECLRRRKELMLEILGAIVQRQRKFFLTGETRDIKPMILRDIANDIDRNQSMVSRATKDKYLYTPFGTTVEMRMFFSSAAKGGEDGEDEVSKHEIMDAIRKFIDEEDKRRPLSDEALTAKLVELGYNIKRRTVAKYRDSLNIPKTTLRRIG